MVASTMDEFLLSLNAWGEHHEQQDEKLAAIEAYISQPHVLAQIVREEARMATLERLHPDGIFPSDDEPSVWYGTSSHLFNEAVAADVDIVSLFFSSPWVDRIPCTLRHFVPSLAYAMTRRPHHLERIEAMLNSTAVRDAPHMQSLLRLLRDILFYFRDQKLLRLLIAHGLEEDLSLDMESMPWYATGRYRR